METQDGLIETAPDLVGIDSDVRGFASMLLSRNIDGPLTIGLFGEWGSGKTFFMRRLERRLREISKDARLKQNPELYWELAHIHFNAWHSSESNLLAAFVESVLEGIKGSLEEADLGEFNDILATMDSAYLEGQRLREAKEGLEQQVAEFESRKEEIERQLSEFNQDKENVLNVENGEYSSARQEIKQAFAEPSVRNIYQRLYWAVDFKEANPENDSAVPPTISVWDAASSPKGLLFGLAGFSTVAYLLFMPFFLTSKDILISIQENLLVLLGAAIIGFAFTVNWYTRQANKLSRKIFTRMREKLESQKIEHEKRLFSIERNFGDKNDLISREIEALERRKTDLTNQINTLERRIGTEGVITRIKDYIERQISETGWASHIGIRSLVRRDFESLSKGMLTQEAVTGVNLAEPERRRIRRVVVYVDDLDRCDPSRVVRVLEAIHQLLLFPLFFTVVAVDARWLSNSLKSHFRETMPIQSLDASGNHTVEPSRASPRDYLEKVFQIAYWLPRIGQAQTTSMLRTWLRLPTVEQIPDDKPKQPSGVIENPSFLDGEKECLLAIASLISRTPRSVKRFGNVYAFLRAAEPPDQFLESAPPRSAASSKSNLRRI